MLNEKELNDLINELYENNNEDKKISFETSSGDKITIEIDKKNDNVDTNSIVYYSFLILIAIVIICFFVGFSFKKDREE